MKIKKSVNKGNGFNLLVNRKLGLANNTTTHTTITQLKSENKCNNSNTTTTINKNHIQFG